ncbi:MULTISPECIES: co-regulatory protein PtrA N-terminal domain-containing protein [Pseudomonas]|uniref:co-regulatory protein PtrA N-terminal domain-containing protein n=1 Tax=Pseudomonas TaxID=286 RepID=UPI00301D9FA2
MNLTKYLLLAVLTLGSSAAMAEGGAERSKQFWEAFRQDQQRLHGDKEQAVVAREREANEKARKLAKD